MLSHAWKLIGSLEKAIKKPIGNLERRHGNSHQTNQSLTEKKQICKMHPHPGGVNFGCTCWECCEASSWSPDCGFPIPAADPPLHWASNISDLSTVLSAECHGLQTAKVWVGQLFHLRLKSGRNKMGKNKSRKKKHGSMINRSNLISTKTPDTSRSSDFGTLCAW